VHSIIHTATRARPIEDLCEKSLGRGFPLSDSSSAEHETNEAAIEPQSLISCARCCLMVMELIKLVMSSGFRRDGEVTKSQECKALH
jgi:hypothetical protein